jgi:succinyl-diaminopimelate desuccinylase
MNYFEVQNLTEQLIAKPSVTPHDHGCQLLIAEYLTKLGFNTEQLPSADVSNLWAYYPHKNPNAPCLIFAGHTDVVPTGPLEQWDSTPFTPTLKGNLLYGRGAADMKGSIAAMLVAVKNFVSKYSNEINGSIGFLITSDEEGAALHGTKHIVEVLVNRQQKIDYCIVGEPSSREYLGDVIKNGRRGSLSGHLTIYGKQGHAAYPHKANNAIHISLALLEELTTTIWDNGNIDFPPTSFQLINIQAGTGATNVIPGLINIEFNFRYASCSSFDSLIEQITTIINKYKLHYNLDWKYNAEPFLTPQGKFTELIQQAVMKITKKECILATDGGTSDGRFIFPAFNCNLIELGPQNHCIHQINEHVDLNDLQQLTEIYEEILKSLLL